MVVMQHGRLPLAVGERTRLLLLLDCLGLLRSLISLEIISCTPELPMFTLERDRLRYLKLPWDRPSSGLRGAEDAN